MTSKSRKSITARYRPDGDQRGVGRAAPPLICGIVSLNSTCGEGDPGDGDSIAIFERQRPPVVPALGNYLVALLKDTPLLSAIAVVDLMQTAKILGSENFRYIEPITLVGLFFLVFSLVAAWFIRRVEARLSRIGRHE